jgi:hypothetical protein
VHELHRDGMRVQHRRELALARLEMFEPRLARAVGLLAA